MTLAAGALFGLVTGTILVSFASTLGATLAFLSSRYVLRDTIEARFGERLKAINAGLERDGAFYLFTLRQMLAFHPLFRRQSGDGPDPHPHLDICLGQPAWHAARHACLCERGDAAGTDPKTGPTSCLRRCSPPSRCSGSSHGLPRRSSASSSAAKVYAGFTRPKTFERNLVVIGAGSAGLVSAYIAAQVKAKVTLVEAKDMGGDCLNTGCVPSKALIKSAKVAAMMRHADHYGLTPAEPQVPFKAVIARVNGCHQDDRAARQRGTLHRARGRCGQGLCHCRRSVDRRSRAQ